MPRPLFRPAQQAQQTQQGSILSATANREQKQQTVQMDKIKLERLLRQPRSKRYMEAVNRLDAGGHVHNRQKVNDIIQTIRDEFPEIEISGVLLGIVSVCYLGKPYEVHSLDITGSIVEHYKSGQAMPGGMEKARSIAMRGGYSFIEVYLDCCRAVSSSGAVSVISC